MERGHPLSAHFWSFKTLLFLSEEERNVFYNIFATPQGATKFNFTTLTFLASTSLPPLSMRHLALQRALRSWGILSLGPTSLTEVNYILVDHAQWLLSLYVSQGGISDHISSLIHSILMQGGCKRYN